MCGVNKHSTKPPFSSLPFSRVFGCSSSTTTQRPSFITPVPIHLCVGSSSTTVQKAQLTSHQASPRACGEGQTPNQCRSSSVVTFVGYTRSFHMNDKSRGSSEDNSCGHQRYKRSSQRSSDGDNLPRYLQRQQVATC